MAGNYNYEVYAGQLLPLIQQLDNALTIHAVPAVPVDTADAQLDVDLANLSHGRLIAQRNSINEIIAKMDAIIRNWHDLLQNLNRAARNHGDQEFAAFRANHNFDALRGNAGIRLNEIMNRLADLDIYIVTRRRVLPPPAVVIPPPIAPHANAPSLPKLEVSKFSDDRNTDWFEWKGHFNASIGNKVQYTNLEKFAHLKALLEGEAAKVIQGITLSDANYNIALDALDLQYGNKEIYKLKLLNQLETLPSCKNFWEVKSFRLEVNSICRLHANADPGNRDLETLTVATRLESKLTVPLMREVAIERARVMAAHAANPANPDWSTTQFRTFLGALVDREALIYGMKNNGENSSKQTTNVSKNQKAKDKSYDSKKQLVSAQTEGNAQESNSKPSHEIEKVAVSSTPPSFSGGGKKQKQQRGRSKTRTPNKSQLFCKLCESKEHFPSDCRKFETIATRKKRADELNICCHCFRRGHETKSCKKPAKCTNCKGEHHIVFCPNKKVLAAAVTLSHTEENDNDFDVFGDSSNSKSTIYGQQPTTRFFMSGTAQAFNLERPNRSEDVVILFDTGAQRSFVNKSLAAQLQLRASFKESIHLGVFGQLSATPMKISVSKIGIRLPNGSTVCLEVSQLDHLLGDIAIYPVESEDEPYLANSVLRGEPKISVAQIMIGIDYFWLFQPQVIRTLPSGYMLLKSLLGLHLCGRGRAQISNVCSLYEMVAQAIAKDLRSDTDLEVLVRRYYIQEDLLQDQLNEHYQSLDDKSVLQKFNNQIQFVNKRYSVRLPFNEKIESLPSNYKLAFSCLRSTLKRLKANNSFLTRYHDNFQELLELEIIETVNNSNPNVGHFLPHQAVLRADKPDKMRIVFNGSARASKTSLSLNHCLSRGPVLLPHIAGLLMRWRSYPIAISADIEKAFLQIDIDVHDRDKTQFLWPKDPFSRDALKDVTTYRFRRVPFGLICSPFCLAGVLTHHFSKYSAEFPHLMDNVYVDNIIVGINDSSKTIDVCKRLKQIAADASMNLREFASNDYQKLNQLDIADLDPRLKVKLLGMLWNTVSDQIEIKLPTFPPTCSVTKRTALAYIAMPFDPSGLVSPLLLAGRQFIGRLWEAEVKWDDKLSDELVREWQELVKSWNGVTFNINRCVVPPNATRIELHGFADASGLGIGSAIYLRAQTDQRFTSNLIYARSCIVPKKLKNTIPRRELHALVLTVKAIEFVKMQLKLAVDKICLYTDSSCTLDWLKNGGAVSRFEQRRLMIIKPYFVLHVRGEDNPADIASRGCDPSNLLNNKFWFNGPSWLSQDLSLFPVPIKIYDPAVDVEITEEKPLFEMALTMETNMQRTLPLLYDTSRTNSWPKMQRVICYVLRLLKLKQRFKKQLPGDFSLNRSSFSDLVGGKPLTAHELANARKFLFKEAQRKDPPSENNKALLNLKLDKDGIFRVQTRIPDQALPDFREQPIYLANESHLVAPIILSLHLDAKHAGNLTILHMLRQQCWVPKARRKIYEVLYKGAHKCMRCRRLAVDSYPTPEEPMLPKLRFDRSKPFTNCGTDYFGPMQAKLGTEQIKVWVCLFACLVTRAIHLELVPDASTAEFLEAYKRFVSRRGAPSIMLSDHGAQSGLAAKIFPEIQNSQEFSRFFAKQNIQWIFITPRAPWRGGLYERLIGLIKRCIRSAIGHRVLPYNQLATNLIEIEAIVNNRPITYISDVDTLQALSPFDFLVPYEAKDPKNDVSSPTSHLWGDEGDPDYFLNEGTREQLLKKLQHSFKIIDKFWADWSSGYVQNLIDSHTRRRRNEPDKRPQLNDVVMIEDERDKFAWKVARIVKLITSNDGRIRTVEVVTGTGSILRRPINKCYPLELSSANEHSALPLETIRPLRAKKHVTFNNPSPISDTVRRSDRLKSKLSNFKTFIENVESDMSDEETSHDNRSHKRRERIQIGSTSTNPLSFSGGSVENLLESESTSTESSMSTSSSMSSLASSTIQGDDTMLVNLYKASVQGKKVRIVEPPPLNTTTMTRTYRSHSLDNRSTLGSTPSSFSDRGDQRKRVFHSPRPHRPAVRQPSAEETQASLVSRKRSTSRSKMPPPKVIPSKVKKTTSHLSQMEKVYNPKQPTSSSFSDEAIVQHTVTVTPDPGERYFEGAEEIELQDGDDAFVADVLAQPFAQPKVSYGRFGHVIYSTAFGLLFVCECPKPTLTDLYNLQGIRLSNNPVTQFLGHLLIRNFGQLILTWNVCRGLAQSNTLHDTVNAFLSANGPAESIQQFITTALPQLRLTNLFGQETILKVLITWWITQCNCANNEIEILKSDPQESLFIMSSVWPEYPVGIFGSLISQLKDHVQQVINKKMINFDQRLTYIHMPVVYLCDLRTTAASREWTKVKSFMFAKILDITKLHSTVEESMRISHNVNYFILWFKEYQTFEQYKFQIEELIKYLQPFERPVILIPPYKVFDNWAPYMKSLQDHFNAKLQIPPSFSGGTRRFQLNVIYPAICANNPSPSFTTKDTDQPTPHGIVDIPLKIRALDLHFPLHYEVRHEQIAPLPRYRAQESAFRTSSFTEAEFQQVAAAISTSSKPPTAQKEFIKTHRAEQVPDVILTEHANFYCDSQADLKSEFATLLNQEINYMLNQFPRRYQRLRVNSGLYPTGSFVTGIDTKDSDFDLCWYISTTTSNLPSFSGRSDVKNKNKGKLQLSDVDTDLYNLGNLLRELVSPRDSRLQPSEILQKVQFPGVNQKHPSRIMMLQLIPVQRFSVISKIELGITNYLAIYNSQLLKAYAKTNRRIVILGKALKKWGKRVGIIASGRGGLNSYAMILLLVYYFIAQNYVPNLQHEYPSLFCIGVHPSNFSSYDSLIVSKGFATANQPANLYNVLIDFLKFYSDFDFEHFAVSIKEGKPVPRTVKKVSNSSSFSDGSETYRGSKHIHPHSDEETDSEDISHEHATAIVKEKIQPTASSFSDAAGDPMLILEPFDDSNNAARNVKSHSKAKWIIETMAKESENGAKTIIKYCALNGGKDDDDPQEDDYRIVHD